jgi:hypothetical protein
MRKPISKDEMKKMDGWEFIRAFKGRDFSNIDARWVADGIDGEIEDASLKEVAESLDYEFQNAIDELESQRDEMWALLYDMEEIDEEEKATV